MEEMVRSTHWNSYYQGKEVPEIPSQFAVFTLGEYRPEVVVDIGCGSGRDSFFFASLGVTTIGIDGSSSAVDLCRQKVSGHPLQFLRLDVGDEMLADKVLAIAGGDGKILVYARFFIHAITDEEEDNLLEQVSRLLKNRPGCSQSNSEPPETNPSIR
jgi:tellurite methyltransferase